MSGHAGGFPLAGRHFRELSRGLVDRRVKVERSKKASEMGVAPVKRRRHTAGRSGSIKPRAENRFSAGCNSEPREVRIDELGKLLAQFLRWHRHHSLLQSKRDDSVHGREDQARQ